MSLLILSVASDRLENFPYDFKLAFEEKDIVQFAIGVVKLTGLVIEVVLD